VYGQGALVMDEEIYRDLKSFHEGFLVKLTIASDATSTLEIVPYVQSDPAPGARRMSQQQEQQFRRSLEEKSRRVMDDACLGADWLKFCEAQKHGYLSALLGHNRVLRKLNAGGLVTKLLHGRRPLLSARNVVCCETHREALETIFNHRLV
jgi:poly-gamma-glutamate synthesis protein (capsule biosynthesis protein)